MRYIIKILKLWAVMKCLQMRGINNSDLRNDLPYPISYISFSCLSIVYLILFISSTVKFMLQHPLQVPAMLQTLHFYLNGQLPLQSGTMRLVSNLNSQTISSNRLKENLPNDRYSIFDVVSSNIQLWSIIRLLPLQGNLY